MTQTAQHIVKEDLDKIVELLRQTFAEEWLAYYQYWIGAQVASGPMRTVITAEFMTHANEELNHATMLSERLLQLGGLPVLNPDEWSKTAKCQYEAPTEACIVKILQQNLKAERCAIGHYQQLCDLCRGIDDITFGLATEILKDEVEHEQEIEDFINDFESVKKCMAESSCQK